MREGPEKVNGYDTVNIRLIPRGATTRRSRSTKAFWHRRLSKGDGLGHDARMSRGTGHGFGLHGKDGSVGKIHYQVAMG